MLVFEHKSCCRLFECSGRPDAIDRCQTGFFHYSCEVHFGFDRLEMEAWMDDYITRNGRPARKGVTKWDANEYPVSSREPGSGTSTNASAGGEFAKALEQITSKKPKCTSQE